MTPRLREKLTGLKIHWPAKERDAYGYAKPACNHVRGFQNPPIITHDAEDVTCGKCQKLVRR